MDGQYGCEGSQIAEALKANVYGNGTQTLVLSHGFGMDQSVWHHLVPYLERFFKVVLYDLAFTPNVKAGLFSTRAYSKYDAYASDLVRLLEEMKVGRAVFVGHSMSTMIGCIAATLRPDLFDHLVLLNVSPRYLNEEGYCGGFDESDLDDMFTAISQDYAAWVEYFVPNAIGSGDAAAIAKFKQSLGRMDPKITLSVAKTVFQSDLRGVLSNVTVPCTVIQSKKDIAVPESVALYVKEKLGSGNCCAVDILETEGHFPMLTAHPLLLKALEKVLRFGA